MGLFHRLKTLAQTRILGFEQIANLSALGIGEAQRIQVGRQVFGIEWLVRQRVMAAGLSFRGLGRRGGVERQGQGQGEAQAGET